MFKKLKRFYYSLLRRIYMWRVNRAVNRMADALGTKLLPALKTATQSFSEFADALQSLPALDEWNAPVSRSDEDPSVI